MDASSPTRNAGVDVLRGMAVLAVVLLHLNLQAPFAETELGRSLPKPVDAVLFWSGFYGVAVFFVVSGYVITNSVLQKWGSLPELKARRFYAMRFARIMPLLGVLLVVLSALHLLEVPHYVIAPDKTSLPRAVFAALTFHVNALEIEVGYLPANWDILWSLSVEEVFYLALPVLCLLVRKEWQFVALVSSFLVISPWARVGLFPDNELGDKNHLAYLDAIAIGCCAALVAHRIEIPPRLRPWLIAVGGGLMLWIIGFRAHVFQLGLTQNGLYITVLSIGTALVLLWMHLRHAEGRATSHHTLGWLSALGRRSYEVYLTHMFVVFACVALLEPSASSDHTVYALYAVAVGLAYVLGAAVERYLSEPANRWLRARWVGPRS